MSSILFTYSLYHLYFKQFRKNYYDSWESNCIDRNSLYLSIFKMGLFLPLQYKIRRSAKKIWLEQSGHSNVVEFFTYFGLPGRVIYIDNKVYIRSTFFLHRSLKIPVTYYRQQGKVKKLFFQVAGAKQNETLTKIFQGQSFTVRSQDMDIAISNKAAKNFKI